MASASLNTKEERRGRRKAHAQKAVWKHNNTSLSPIHKTVIIQIRTAKIQQRFNFFFFFFFLQFPLPGNATSVPFKCYFIFSFRNKFPPRLTSVDTSTVERHVMYLHTSYAIVQAAAEVWALYDWCSLVYRILTTFTNTDLPKYKLGSRKRAP